MDERHIIYPFLFICAAIGAWMIHSSPKPKEEPVSRGAVSPRTWEPFDDDEFEREIARMDKIVRRRDLRKQMRERLIQPKSYRRDKALADLTVKAHKYVALFGWKETSRKARRMYAVLAHVRRMEVYRQQWRT